MHVQVARVVHELLLQQLQARRGVRLQRLNRRGIGRVQRRTVMIEPLVVKLVRKSVRSWSRLQYRLVRFWQGGPGQLHIDKAVDQCDANPAGLLTTYYVLLTTYYLLLTTYYLLLR